MVRRDEGPPPSQPWGAGVGREMILGRKSAPPCLSMKYKEVSESQFPLSVKRGPSTLPDHGRSGKVQTRSSPALLVWRVGRADALGFLPSPCS